ncbi:alpha/beta hydrolase [Pedobacter rhodius]|uniref:Alpha/beta hydrolase n=1 Tax=Pedobacter rhodius TaxID=3004098 RepID=A0ABT4KYF9_9SPHI|nr:alpha/beta hydrolase [Pedobacter sp. SJ11]MCZ4223959.1 alpha/beta hydrolase [Pedobacter sp. SJ11]
MIKFFIFLLMSSTAALAQKDTVRQTDLKYGNFERNRLDLYLPPDVTPKTPFVILIHGGAWVQAGKEYVRDFQEYLLKQGIASVNLNHRYANDSTIHYKQILEDIDQAANYCVKNAAKWNTRADGFSTAGFSSGAHLALLYGYTSSKKINAIVDFSGPTNFTDTSTLNYCIKANLMGLVEKIAGNRFTDVKHVPESFALASPITYAKNIPTFIAHGVIDPVVQIRQSQQLAEKLRSKKAAVEFIQVPGLAHDLDKKPIEKLALYKAAVAFIKKYGQKK